MTTKEEVRAEMKKCLEKIHDEEKTPTKGVEYLYQLKRNYAQYASLLQTLKE